MEFHRSLSATRQSRLDKQPFKCNRCVSGSYYIWWTVIDALAYTYRPSSQPSAARPEPSEAKPTQRPTAHLPSPSSLTPTSCGTGELLGRMAWRSEAKTGEGFNRRASERETRPLTIRGGAVRRRRRRHRAVQTATLCVGTLRTEPVTLRIACEVAVKVLLFDSPGAEPIGENTNDRITEFTRLHRAETEERPRRRIPSRRSELLRFPVRIRPPSWLDHRPQPLRPVGSYSPAVAHSI